MPQSGCRLDAPQGSGEPAAGPWRAAWRVGGAVPRARPCLWDDNHDPARAVVTPPHLPAKMNVFYALMHRRLVAARCGLRGDWRPGSSMQSYAPWLCSRGRGDEWPTGSNGHCGARAEANQQLAERVQVSSLAFPDDQDGPARRCQFVLVASVARNIAVEFSGPVVGTRFRSGGCRAARMLVPETAMNEQCDTTAREH